MSVTIQRQGGVWRAFVDGVEWNPQAGGLRSDATFLDGRADLMVGVFAITPFNAVTKTVTLKSFTALVDHGAPPSLLETWRAEHFGPGVSPEQMADEADPDGDGVPNLLEYALGSGPMASGDAARPAAGTAAGGAGAEETWLTLGFSRVADPALRYVVEAADGLAGPWTPIWESSGTANTAGPVTVTDPMAMGGGRTARFLRLRVER